jgi:hypothetical protein
MGKIRGFFEKAGGRKLLKQWAKAGVLLDAIGLFLLLGHSKTALEQLRNAVSLKIQNKLRKKFRKEIENLHNDGSSSCAIYNNVSAENNKQATAKDSDNNDINKTVWIFWWQGIENAPELVKVCYRSVVKNMKDWDIILITQDNYKEYTNIPDFIIEKLNKGVITLTHFSDILRLDLLKQHGGLWLDATVLCTNGNVPKSILQSDLFVYQTQKPGADGKATLMSSWCMWAWKGNHILKATQSLLYSYWKRYNFMMDYFLLHQFMTIVMKEFPEEARHIPPYTNENPHLLLLHFFDRYDEHLWNDWKHQSFFHKLSYKLNKKKDMGKAGTFYDVIIRNNAL